ncbi:hypothetical protein ACFZDI_26000 [Streptomyces sp. NPDC007907]|uniref:hypothetical protein n=1 Tax=Streptomyces sp. NPDC007907 TaxID=3364789 RepID=UPI0036E46236
MAAPVVSSVTPVQGPASGGTTVTLTRDRPDRPRRVTTPAGTSNAVTYSRIAAPVI